MEDKSESVIRDKTDNSENAENDKEATALDVSLQEALGKAFWGEDTDEPTEAERDEIIGNEIRETQSDFLKGYNMALSDVAALAFKEFDPDNADVQQAEFYSWIDEEIARFGHF